MATTPPALQSKGDSISLLEAHIDDIINGIVVNAFESSLKEGFDDIASFAYECKNRTELGFTGVYKSNKLLEQQWLYEITLRINGEAIDPENAKLQMDTLEISQNVWNLLSGLNISKKQTIASAKNVLNSQVKDPLLKLDRLIPLRKRLDLACLATIEMIEVFEKDENLEKVPEGTVSLPEELKLAIYAKYNIQAPTRAEPEAKQEETIPLTKSKPKLHTWANDSDDDDEELIAIVKQSQVRGPATPSTILLPGDLEQEIPFLFKAFSKFCNNYGLVIQKETDTLMSKQSYRYSPIHDAKDMGEVIAKKTSIEDRLSLATLAAAASLLRIKPQDILEVLTKKEEIAISYFCTILAQHGVDSEKMPYLKIALKNGDGGASVFKDRLTRLCQTGSSASNLLFEAFNKCFVAIAKKQDTIDDETSKLITNRTFTSIDGMLTNCYHDVKKKVKVKEEKIIKGKKVSTFVEKEQIGKNVPDLKISAIDLTDNELAKLEPLVKQFNNRRAEVERRISLIAEKDRDLYTLPKVCKDVVEDAYKRLGPMKRLAKERKNAIREAAAKAAAANKESKITQSLWLSSRSEFLKTVKEVSDITLSRLEWVKSKTTEE